MSLPRLPAPPGAPSPAPTPVLLLLLLSTAGWLLPTSSAGEIYRDCTRDLYDRVVRFEYLYYEGYWMYPYNKLRQHGPSYHYTEKEFCESLTGNTGRWGQLGNLMLYKMLAYLGTHSHHT